MLFFVYTDAWLDAFSNDYPRTKPSYLGCIVVDSSETHPGLVLQGGRLLPYDLSDHPIVMDRDENSELGCSVVMVCPD